MTDQPDSTNGGSRYLALLVVGLACFVLGYFAGREHLKYEFRSAVEGAFSGVSEIFGSSTTEQEEQVAPEVLDYMASVKVYAIKARRTSKSFITASRKPMIDGKIRNAGERTLKKIVLRFFFADRAGNIIFEDTGTELYDYNSLMGGDVAPLRPGYISEFFHVCKECPSECVAKPARIEIADIEFAD